MTFRSFSYIVCMFLAAAVLAGCTYDILPADATSGAPADTAAPAGDDMPPITGKKQGWSQSGNLVTANKNKFVSMQIDLDADNYTIQVASQQPNSGAQTEALVTWTVNGNPIQRRMTVPGSLTGCGENVKVQIFDVTDVVNYPSFVANVTYGVSVSVTRGTRGTNESPPVLIPGASGLGAGVDFGPGLYIIPAATIDTIPIPQGVGVISVFVTCVDLNGSPVVVDNSKAQIAMGVIGFGVEVGAAPVNLGAWIPVPPGATVLAMRNAQAGGSHALAFNIAFGIDG